jgi:hypothetical protein
MTSNTFCSCWSHENTLWKFVCVARGTRLKKGPVDYMASVTHQELKATPTRCTEASAPMGCSAIFQFPWGVAQNLCLLQHFEQLALCC